MKYSDITTQTEQQILAEAINMVEMANLFPQQTGLPVVVWFGEVGGQHGPRIKVSNVKGKMTHDCFVVSVSKQPVVLTPRSCKLSQSTIEDVFDWVVLNYDTLMQLWNVHESGDGDSMSLLAQLKRI